MLDDDKAGRAATEELGRAAQCQTQGIERYFEGLGSVRVWTVCPAAPKSSAWFSMLISPVRCRGLGLVY